MLPALIYVLRRRDSNFLWAFPYSLFWIAALSWISLWALLTPQRNSWLTRGLGKHPPAAVQEPVAETWAAAATAGLAAMPGGEAVFPMDN
jgi:hyaluronan synthase